VIGKYSGIETYYEEAGKRLAGMGHQVTAYCRSYFTPKINAHHGIQIIRLPTVRSKHLETFVHSFLSTVHACFSDHDIVHYHALGPSLFSFLPRLFGKKTVVTVQGLDWQRKKWHLFARAVLKLGEKASAVLPNKTIVVSRTLRGYYGARYSNPTIYVPNGTEIREPRVGLNLERFGLTPNGYALFLGRFSPEKNCHLLIEAFENIETSVKLVLAGGGSHTNDYVTELYKHASERIVFIDWLAGDALEEVLTNAALFVLPSDIEGLSLALLDAMGAGLCVLTSDTPENCEAVGDAGFTFTRGSVIDLRRMLDLLLGDEALRRSAAQIARARVQENYLWEKVVNEMNCVYADLVRPIPMKIKKRPTDRLIETA
jgi:Glycosyltransferase